MKNFLSALALLTATPFLVFGGSYDGKEMKQTAAPPCPDWYADNEWNVTLWGTYLFTNTDFDPNPSLVDITQSSTEGAAVYGTYDRYIGNDHAWGGGGDIKYFFHKYFGLGVEGFVVDAHKQGFDIFEDPTVPVFTTTRTFHNRAIGAVLGTFTLRYPVPCTRYAPYAFAGIGGIFGGGESDEIITTPFRNVPPDAFHTFARTEHSGSRSELMAQFGGGLEIRITKNIGWINDLSWGVIDGPRNNFGMIRTGLNFAF